MFMVPYRDGVCMRFWLFHMCWAAQRGQSKTVIIANRDRERCQEWHLEVSSPPIELIVIDRGSNNLSTSGEVTRVRGTTRHQPGTLFQEDTNQMCACVCVCVYVYESLIWVFVLERCLLFSYRVTSISMDRDCRIELETWLKNTGVIGYDWKLSVPIYRVDYLCWSNWYSSISKKQNKK